MVWDLFNVYLKDIGFGHLHLRLHSDQSGAAAGCWGFVQQWDFTDLSCKGPQCDITMCRWLCSCARRHDCLLQHSNRLQQPNLEAISGSFIAPPVAHLLWHCGAARKEEPPQKWVGQTALGPPSLDLTKCSLICCCLLLHVSDVLYQKGLCWHKRWTDFILYVCHYWSCVTQHPHLYLFPIVLSVVWFLLCGFFIMEAVAYKLKRICYVWI